MPAPDPSKSENDQGPTQANNAPQSSFVPGGIHRKEVADFWRNELQAGEWVMDVIEQGYVIPVNDLPEQYEEPNNQSARKNMTYVQAAVEDLWQSGVVRFVDKKPKCVSPLTVVEKMEPDGTIKRRLCWDGSRCVNAQLKEEKVTLAHLQRALEITREGVIAQVQSLQVNH